MSDQQQASFEGWASVEVMGHQRHVGFVRTEAYGAAVLFRVDVPDLPERDDTLTEPQWIGGEWIPAGAKVRRAAAPGHSVLVGAGSIYRILPCDEATAMKAVEVNRRPELKLIELPPGKALPGPEMPPPGPPVQYDGTQDRPDEGGSDEPEF